MVSVIIPFRNESLNMERLLKDVFQLSANNFEVIFVNDHSTDDTMHWLDNIGQSGITISVISLTDTYGKKEAIMKGIENAKGEIIITTDADCTLDPLWVEHLRYPFQGNASFVFGPVDFQAGGSLFSQIQRLELVILQVFSGATWAMGFPTMCNGANLAYRKDEFKKVDGFLDNAHIPSGDDEFTMHKMFANKQTIRFVKPQKPDITTNTENDFHSFFNQRKRWSGKWKNYKHTPSKLLALFVLIFNLIYALIPVVFIAGIISLETLIFIILGKMIFEWTFLTLVKGYFNLHIRIIPFLLLSVVYPYYVVLFGFVSQVGTFIWKERKYE